MAGEPAGASYLAAPDVGHEALIFLRRTQAEDAGYGGDNEGVAAGEQGASGGVAELVELFVDVGVFFDVEVGAGDVGFGLVVVVVADEVFDGVVGEEFLELGGELGGEGLVVGYDEGGALEFLDDVGHGEGLAASGDAHEGLVNHVAARAVDNLFDGLGLVAGGAEVGDYLEVGQCGASSPDHVIYSIILRDRVIGHTRQTSDAGG